MKGRRLGFVLFTLALGILVAPLDAGAQQPGRVYRVGRLSGQVEPASLEVL